jgi:protein-disulfide isomerase
LKKYAEQLGLDMDKFENCLDSSAKAKYVTADYNEGIGKGVGGTPTFFINDVKLQYWNYGNFSMAIENALALTALSEASNESITEDTEE